MGGDIIGVKKMFMTKGSLFSTNVGGINGLERKGPSLC